MLFEFEFKVMPEIPAQQNLVHGPASMSVPNAESKVISNVPEAVMSGFSSAVKEMSATSEDLPPSITNDISFAAEGSLSQIDSSQEKHYRLQIL